MKDSVISTLIFLCGIITTTLTVMGVSKLYAWTSFDLFSLWIVVPGFGALFIGGLSASGIYMGSVFFNKPINTTAIIQLFSITTIVPWLVYYSQFTTDQHIQNFSWRTVFNFLSWLPNNITNSTYELSLEIHEHAIPLVNIHGAWVYLLAFIQYSFCVSAGAGIQMALEEKPLCTACNKYFTTIKSMKKEFATTENFTDYYDNFYNSPLDSHEFSEKVLAIHKVKDEKKWNLVIELNLSACPICNKQIIEESVRKYLGEKKGWDYIDLLHRVTHIPEEINLTPAFGKK